MDFTPEKLKSLTKWFIAVISACIIIFLGLHNVSSVFGFIRNVFSIISPLLIGFGFSLVLNVPMKFFEGKLFPKSTKTSANSLRRLIAFIISLALIFGIIVGIVFLILPELSHAFQVLSESVIEVTNKLSTMSNEEIQDLPFGSWLLKINWQKLLDTAQSWLKNQSGTILNTAFDTIGSVIKGVFDFFIAFVFAIYILFSKEKLKNQAVRVINAWLPKKVGRWFIHASEVASRYLRNFISGQFIEAVIIGVLCFIGMIILGFPYAPMISVLVCVTALIPIVGAFIGAIVGCFMILTISPLKAIFFLIFLLILQQLEGNLIYPKVMGSRVNLPGMWILAAVTVGGAIAGPFGMLISVPVASTVYLLFKEATAKRELVMTNLHVTVDSDGSSVEKSDADNHDIDKTGN